MANNNFIIKHLLESANHPSLSVRMDTAFSDRVDLKEKLMEDDTLTEEEIDNMTPFELLDHALQWEGIVGYTQDIMTWVLQAIGLGLQDDEIRELGL